MPNGNYPLWTQSELEDVIKRETGLYPGMPREDGNNLTLDHATMAMISAWLSKVGVSHEKLLTISERGKINSFKAGEAWVKKTHTDEKFGSFKPKASRPRVDFDTNSLDLESPKSVDERMKELLGVPKESQPEVQTQTSQTPSLSEEETVQITSSMLTRMGEKILTPQIDRAKDEIIQRATKGIQIKLDAIKSELNDHIADKIKTEREDVIDRAIDKASEVAVEEARIVIKDMADQCLAAVEKYIIERIPTRIEIKTPQKTKILDEALRHEAFEEVVFYAACGMHVYMWGPRGTGKTALFPQVADALDKRYVPIAQSLSKYDVSGYMSPTGDYIGTHARDAIENGGLLGVDEGDAWAAAALIFLNTPLANNYCAFPDKIVQTHPDFQCMIAANTTGFGATPEYQGRNPLDSTSTDRFVFVHIDYDEKLERNIFGNTPWTNYIHTVRRYVRKELKNPAAVPSMRPIQMGSKLLAAGADPERMVKAVLWKALPQDLVDRIENACGRFGKVSEVKVA